MGQTANSYSAYYTLTDWENWQDPWELIHGQPYCMSPAPSLWHQEVNSLILAELIPQVRTCGKCKVFMPVDWEISEDTVVQPDVSIVCKNAKGKRLLVAPTVIFEILSPATEKKDRTIKFDLYESQKVEWYVLVDPQEQTTEVFHLSERGKYERQPFNGIIRMDIVGCPVVLDMGKVWG